MPIQLPPEVLEQVLQAILPVNVPVAFASNDTITKTLLSLSLTSRSLSPTACHLLYSHCLHIDSAKKLQLVTQSFGCLRVQNALCRPSIRPMGMFLAPYHETIDVPDIADHILKLFGFVDDRLKRLIIDIPLRSLYPEDDVSLYRPKLQEAFLRLTALEEFCSIRDELFLATAVRFEQEQVWGSWAKLQRLALYNVDTSWTPFLKALEQVTALTHLVLTRADGLGDEIEVEELHIPQSLVCVIVVNIRESRPFGYIDPSYPTSFLGQLPSVFKAAKENDGRARELQEIYVPALNEKDLEDPITLCQDFVKHHACTGSLWNLKSLPLDVVNTAQEDT